jgi:cytidylate kinase
VIIAIDGPAGAGKSSVARALADRLGFNYLDTGALYRAAALAVLEEGLVEKDGAEIASLVQGLDIACSNGRVTLGGRDVSARVRDDDVTEAVPSVSAVPGVRSALARIQRAAAHSGNVVMEGRDLGTVVVPDADLKIFLTASLDERARRRARQQGVSEIGPEFESIKAAIAERDTYDSTRGHSPLKRAEDAILVDSTEMSEEEVVRHIAALAAAHSDG